MIFNRGIDTMKITALSNHKPGILNNYIRIHYIMTYHLCSPPVFSGVRVTRSLDRCLSFCPFLLAIVLSVLLRIRLLITPPDQESEWTCICVLDVLILPLFTILILDFGKVPTVCYFWYFLFFLIIISILINT